MECPTEDFKTAAKRYKADSGEHYIRPDRKQCHFTRGAWYLLDKHGNVICIAGPTHCLFGGRLAYYFHEMQSGIPPATNIHTGKPVLGGY